MIVRTWRCRATAAKAEEYHRYITGTVFAHLATIDGHRGVQLLRRELDGEIEFVALSFWDSYDAVREYAGDYIDTAMVQPEAQAMLSHFDTFADHYELAHTTIGEG